MPTVGGECVFEAVLRRQPAGERVRAGRLPQGRDLLRQGGGRGQPGDLRGRAHRARRHPRRVHGLAPSSPRNPSRSGPTCRWATRSWKSCCSKPASRPCRPAPSSASRTWARPASPAPPARWAAAAAVGIEIELDRVPQRETGMTPYEIMLSESQERMLLVAEKGREEKSSASSASGAWTPSTIGVVTGDGKLRVRHHGEVVAEIPNRELADEAPLYDRPHTKPLRTAPMDAPALTSRQPDSATCRRCWLAPTSAPSAGSGSSTITRCAPTPGRARARGRRHRAHQGNRHLAGHVARRQRPLLLSFAARRRASWPWPSAAAISRPWARSPWPPPIA